MNPSAAALPAPPRIPTASLVTSVGLAALAAAALADAPPHPALRLQPAPPISTGFAPTAPPPVAPAATVRPAATPTYASTRGMQPGT